MGFRRYLSKGKAHDPSNPRVPIAGCRCATCEDVRVDRYNDIAGALFGLEDYGTCECGRALDEAGRCIAYWQCQFSVKA